jgi:hypothetical protein
MLLIGLPVALSILPDLKQEQQGRSSVQSLERYGWYSRNKKVVAVSNLFEICWALQPENVLSCLLMEFYGCMVAQDGLSLKTRTVSTALDSCATMKSSEAIEDGCKYCGVRNIQS